MSCAKVLSHVGAFCIAVSLLAGGTPALAAASSTTSGPSPASEKLVVHEWGTFTSLQDENGQALGGINVDDEPVPQFVHQWMPAYVVGAANGRAIPAAKGLDAKHPYVTLRLETPVLYFHPPKSQTAPINLSVNVQFKGGWLSQYYPMAQSDLPSKITSAEFSRLPLDRRGDLRIGLENLVELDRRVLHELHFGQRREISRGLQHEHVGVGCLRDRGKSLNVRENQRDLLFDAAEPGRDGVVDDPADNLLGDEVRERPDGSLGEIDRGSEFVNLADMRGNRREAGLPEPLKLACLLRNAFQRT
jgi:hypothetical protein